MIAPEIIRAARSANLVFWLQDNGFQLKKEGSNYRLPGNGGLLIKENRWHQFSTGAKGNAIDFLTNFLGMDFKDAVVELTGSDVNCSHQVVRRYRYQPEERPKYVTPEAFNNTRRVIAYLTKTRKLPTDLVINLIKKRLIWQDQRGNCVFPCHDEDGNIVGTMLRGTLSDVRWVGITPGSDVSPGWVLPGQGTTLVVTESPIEAMSLYTLKPDLRGNVFLALGGLHWASVRSKVQKGGIDSVILALNPDRWGKEAAAEIESWLLDQGIDTNVLQPKAKEDWNAELVSSFFQAR